MAPLHFFFQAEDGIRDTSVTGVQTCALPISQRMQLASGIFQLYSRTPALTAMTAAGLDYVSGGRFTLGLGASGPQVIEGWHGVPYDAPLGRTREIIEICRMVWRRERLSYQARSYHLPL